VVAARPPLPTLVIDIAAANSTRSGSSARLAVRLALRAAGKKPGASHGSHRLHYPLGMKVYPLARGQLEICSGLPIRWCRGVLGFCQTATADVVCHATISASWGLNLDDCNNTDKIIVLSAKGPRQLGSEMYCRWGQRDPRGARLHLLRPFVLSQDCKRFGQYDRQRYPRANGRQPGFGRPRFQQPQELPALPCNYSCNLPIGA